MGSEDMYDPYAMSPYVTCARCGLDSHWVEMVYKKYMGSFRPLCSDKTRCDRQVQKRKSLKTYHPPYLD